MTGMSKVPPPRENPIVTHADWVAQRQALLTDPGAFFDAIARGTLHWYDRQRDAWITRNDAQGRWTGFDAGSGAPVELSLGVEHQPWRRPSTGGTR
jgi:hypothetical protein